MQEVKFSAILANACRLAGRDPSASSASAACEGGDCGDDPAK
jgi:hypothetical protein